MARRCSLCGSWNGQTATECYECGEKLGARRTWWRPFVGAIMAVGGAALIGMNFIPALAPLFDPRSAGNVRAIVLLLAGVIALGFGMSRRSR